MVSSWQASIVPSMVSQQYYRSGQFCRREWFPLHGPNGVIRLRSMSCPIFYYFLFKILYYKHIIAGCYKFSIITHSDLKWRAVRWSTAALSYGDCRCKLRSRKSISKVGQWTIAWFAWDGMPFVILPSFFTCVYLVASRLKSTQWSSV